eukprot:TRINITY_DN12615_c1_g2_i2.p1 TRINITY_DN12615_c1_g2~~TRINITY_DN12615_c1_g2_i2.p1  ORF type:complete len:762 (+),score=200.83 TRINITY_DN12615_c1_g2_i2:37-2286(+)
MHEFTSMDEYQSFFALFRAKLLEVVRAIGGNRPKLAIEYAGGRLQEVMRADQSAVDLRLLRNSWDGVAVFWEAVMATAYPIIAKEIYKPIYKQVFEFLRQCLSAALAWDNTDSLLLVSELTVLSALLPCLDLCPEAFPEVVKKLFAAMEHKALADHQLLKSEAQKAVTRTGLTDGARVRRKAGTTLVAMCRSPPKCFMDGLEYICAASQALLQKPEIGEMQRRQLMEAVVSSFNTLDSQEQHASALQMFLGDDVAQWASDDVAALVATPTVLAMQGSLTQPGVNEAQPFRTQLLAWLNSLYVMARCTKARDKAKKTMMSGGGGCPTGGSGHTYAYTAMLRHAVPNVFKLISSLHLFESSNELAEPHYYQLLDLRRSDAYAFLSNTIEAASRVMTHDELWLDRAQMWLFTLRENSYLLLSYMAESGLLYEEDIASSFSYLCLQAIPELRLRDFKLLIKCAGFAFIRHLPRDEARLNVFGDMIDLFFQTSYAKLQQCLQAKQQGQRLMRDTNSAGLSPEQLEILDDKLMADTLELVINLIDQLTADRTIETNTTIENRSLHVAQLGTTAMFVLGREKAFEAILTLLTTCMSNSTPTASRKCATVLTRLVPALSQLDAYVPILASTVVTAMLSGLEVYGEHGDCLNSLLSLAVKCAMYLTQNDNAVMAFAQVPNFDMAALETLVTGIKEGRITNSKTMKSSMRSLLDDIIGVNVSKAFKTNAKVLDIPQKFKIVKPDTPDEDNAIDLEQLFG